MRETYTVTASTTIDAPPATVWDARTDPETFKQAFFVSEISTIDRL